MISPSKVVKAIQHPTLAFRFLKNCYTDLGFKIDQFWYNHRYAGLGDEFVNSKWDNLLILDAARPDILSSVDKPSDSDLSTRISPGSFSLQFMEEQFFGRELHDTVYVTANPHVRDLPGGVFHDVINLLEIAWDESLQTVPPEPVVKAAIDAHERHPDKRLIVHFMQPHFPFIGPTGRKIPSGIAKRAGNEDKYRHPWFEQMWNQEHDPDVLVEAYRENHEIVLPHAKELIDKLPGRSVITSDHANLIGERGFPIPIQLYGHPRNFKHPNLLRVPWIEFGGDPREVVAESPSESGELDNEVISKRLAVLGYR